MIFLRTMAILIPLLMFGTQEALAKQGHPTTSATQECTPAKHKADSSLPILLAQSAVSKPGPGQSCSATSSDGQNSCSVTCKANERAICGNTQTTVECRCKS